MVKTKCLKDPLDAIDGKRILVTRFWPRGMTKDVVRIDEWATNVAPSRELLADWKAEHISWSEYVARYKREMSQQTEAIGSLAALAASETITMLCYEAEDDPHCHRHLLKEMLDNWGIYECRKA